MISALVFIPEDAWRSAERETLGRSLAWLVTAVVAGVVRDVMIAGPAGMGIDRIAEQTGCVGIEGGDEPSVLHEAIERARSPRLLVLQSGFQPAESMVSELDALDRRGGPAEARRLLRTPSSRWQRLFPDRAATVGLFAPLASCRALPACTFRQLQAALRPRLVFASRAFPLD